MTDWQPISTAPKDGTQILAYGPYVWEDYWKSGFDRTGWAVIYWENDGWRLANANPYADYMDPTHWIPLPEPPA